MPADQENRYEALESVGVPEVDDCRVVLSE